MKQVTGIYQPNASESIKTRSFFLMEYDLPAGHHLLN